MSGATAGTTHWLENDLSFLAVWAAVAGFFVVYRWRGGNRDLRAVAGSLCLAGFMGGWYAGYQVQTSGMYVPLAQDVVTLTGLVAGLVYVVAVLRNGRRGAASEAETTDEVGTPPEAP